MWKTNISIHQFCSLTCFIVHKVLIHRDIKGTDHDINGIAGYLKMNSYCLKVFSYIVHVFVKHTQLQKYSRNFLAGDISFQEALLCTCDVENLINVDSLLQFKCM